MNRKQRARKHRRRVAHAASTGKPPIMTRESYPVVKKGHIVPAVYQRNFATSEQVAVHFKGKPGFEIRNVRTAGTRRSFYKRTRPDGTKIDDIEASLSVVENKAQPVFAAVTGGDVLTMDHKHVLATFFGMQMVRGPAFFSERADLWGAIVSGLGSNEMKPSALARASGDANVVRREFLDAQLSTTARFKKMLTLAVKIGSVLGSMRWHLLDFGQPVLAYSDQPVVVWPADVPATEPFTKPKFGPLNAVEVRVPLSSQLAILMTWSDVPDKGSAIAAELRFAGELNAFVIAQADEQWMHRPGREPPIAQGRMSPLSRAFELAYTPADLARSQRRAFAAQFLHRVRNKEGLRTVELANMGWAT